MVKLAQLANGKEMQFPDDTPDELMDAVVQQYVQSSTGGVPGQAPVNTPTQDAAQPPVGQDGGMMAMLVQGISQYMASQQQEQEVEAAKRQEDVKQQMELQAIACAHQIDAVKGAAQNVGAAVQSLSESLVPALSDIATGTQQIKELISAINNLSSTVLEGVKAIVTTLNTPREIYHGADKTPIGIGPAKNITELL